MLLGGSIVGGSILFNAGITPPPTTYDTVRVYGQSRVDKIRILSEVLTEAQILAISPPDTFTWTPTTLLYAEFDDTLNAGNISGITNPITSWLLFRRRVEDTLFKQIATLAVGDSSYIDYEAKANKDYIYRLYAESSDELSNPLTADIVSTSYYNWSLTDPDTGQLYLFNLNLSSGSLSTSSSMHVYGNAYSEHPSVSFSDNKSIRGSIQALAGSVPFDGSTDLVYPQDYLDDLETFIHNGKSKILKDRRGRGWIVATDNFKSSYIDVVGDQIANISFDFVETANLDS